MILSPEQQAIVNHRDGPALVTAVAGAGKSRVVVERAKLLHGKVMVVTFSRSAADEIRRRIGKGSVTVTTAHALAFKLLNRPKIDEMRFRFLADRVRRDHKRYDIDLEDLLEAITLTKSKLDPVPPSTIAQLYYAIEEKKASEGVMTFDDLLLEAAHFNMTEHTIQFDHVIQDEAQDQNEVQEGFITSCVDENYMSVADPWQTCFEFRGADPSFVSEAVFKANWPGAKIFTLNTNYRSVPSIVAAADAISVSRAVANRAATSNGVTFTKHDSVIDEAISLAEEIQHLRTVRLTPQEHMNAAILYRRHTQAGVIECALHQAAVPFYSVKRFSELPKVQPLLSYLWLAANRATVTDVRRSLNRPFRFIPSVAAERLGASPEPGLSWMEHVRKHDVPEKCEEWARVVDRLMLVAENQGPVAVVKTLMSAIGIENSQGLLEVSYLYTDLDDMLDDLSASHDKKGVRLSSIHEAKGMEWEKVYFVGWEKKPERWDPDAGCYVIVPEEQRLNYVAFTRAKDELHVSSISTSEG